VHAKQTMCHMQKISICGMSTGSL